MLSKRSFILFFPFCLRVRFVMFNISSASRVSLFWEYFFFILCVTISSCNELFCSFKFVVMNLCILLSFQPGNIYFSALRRRSTSMFSPFLFESRFLVFWNSFLSGFYLLLWFFFSIISSECHRSAFCIHFSQCNISSIMKVQLIT